MDQSLGWATQPHRHRIFFALRPGPALHPHLATYRDLVGCGDPVDDDRLHLTLAITGDFAAEPTAVIRAMQDIGERIDAEPFDLTLDRLTTSDKAMVLRPSRRPAALGILHRQLRDGLGRRGLIRPGWTFAPHVTLRYAPYQPADRPVPPILWHAARVVLIHSLVGLRRHRLLGRWPLLQRQQSLPF